MGRNVDSTAAPPLGIDLGTTHWCASGARQCKHMCIMWPIARVKAQRCTTIGFHLRLHEPQSEEYRINLYACTRSCMAYVGADGKTTVIKTKDGDQTMPSHVAFTKAGRRVGAAAKNDVSGNASTGCCRRQDA